MSRPWRLQARRPNIGLTLSNSHANLHVGRPRHPQIWRNPLICCINYFVLLDQFFVILSRGLRFEVAARTNLEQRLPVEIAVFEVLKGGVFSVLISETFDGDHSSGFLFLGRQALMTVYSNDLTEAKMPHVFYALFFRH